MSKSFESTGKCKNYVVSNCLENSAFLKDLVFKQVLGQGLQGLTILGCSDTNCNHSYAIKISILNAVPVSVNARRHPPKCNSPVLRYIPFAKMITKILVERANSARQIRTNQDFKLEVETSTKAGELGIGPKIYESKICMKGLYSPDFGFFDVGIIVMEALETTLQAKIDKDEFFLINRYTKIRKELKRLARTADKHQLYHPDLHFENIMLDKHGKFKLIDWGFVIKSKKKLPFTELDAGISMREHVFQMCQRKGDIPPRIQKKLSHIIQIYC